MGADDDEREEIPKEFLSFADRHHLDFKHTLAGITLILGCFGVYIGALFAIWPATPEDISLGILIGLFGVALLLTSLLAYRRRVRKDSERFERYLEWKRSRGDDEKENPTGP